MVASVASFGSLNLAQGLTARAVAPVAIAPVLRDQPRPPAAPNSASPNSASPNSASHVAFAPTAMTALIEAQERLAQDAPMVVRQDTAQKLDQLIVRLNDESAPAATHADVPFAVRQLIVARQALSESLIDLQA